MPPPLVHQLAVPQKARLEICERMISPQQLFERCSTQVPELNPTEIDDLLMGCGLPGGEQGFNHGRVGAVQLGHDYLPATTITKYCASSLQTTRMALDAIKAGEGEVHISAGVECVSRYVHGNSDSWPSTTNPVSMAPRLVPSRWQRAIRRGRTLVSRDIFPMSTSLWARPRRILRPPVESVAKNRMTSAFEVSDTARRFGGESR